MVNGQFDRRALHQRAFQFFAEGGAVKLPFILLEVFEEDQRGVDALVDVFELADVIHHRAFRSRREPEEEFLAVRVLV